MKKPSLDIADELLEALDSAVSGVAAIRQQINALQAAEALCLAAGASIAESIAQAGHHPDGAEMAHRMVASDMAAAMHESDRTLATRMWRAAMLTNDYPLIFASLSAGRISAAHATVITEAGLIITDETQRNAYASEILHFAETESVGRLRPVAKELAERFADRTIDERHEAAQACRMVRVVPLEDGMADLIATLPALLAYGIKDRLDQAAHFIKSEGQGTASSGRQNRAQSRAQNKAGSEAHGKAFFAAQPGATQRGAPDSDLSQPHASQPDASQSASQSDAPQLDARKIDEIRADVLTDMLLTADLSDAARMHTSGIASIQARVHVIVPGSKVLDGDLLPAEAAATSAGAATPAGAATSAGAATPPSSAKPPPESTPMPATLSGYGPIDANTAQLIAAHATSWQKVTVEAQSGDVIRVDTYRPNSALRKYLGARDLHCRFPGCRIPIRKCDIDHTIDAAHGGPTASTNLAHLCRRHHTMKHATPWRVTQDEMGTLRWVSPTGRTHNDRPASRVRFRSTPGSNAKEGADAS